LRRHCRPEVEPLAGTRAASFQLLEPCHLARRRFAMPIAGDAMTADTLMRRDIDDMSLPVSL